MNIRRATENKLKIYRKENEVSFVNKLEDALYEVLMSD
jgi:hypothetical protein